MDRSRPDPILIRTGLDRSLHDDHAAFAEILGYKFSRIAPSDNVDPVSLFVLAFWLEGTVDGDVKAGDRNLRLRVLQFWIGGESSHKCNGV